MITCNCTTACASTPASETTKLHLVGYARYSGMLAIALAALEPASTQIQVHGSWEKRGFFRVGHTNKINPRICMTLVAFACQKLESYVLPAAASSRCHALTANTMDSIDMPTTSTVNVERMFCSKGYASAASCGTVASFSIADLTSLRLLVYANSWNE